MNRQDLLRELANRRKYLGLTQKDVANQLGCTQPFIAKVESGKHDVSMETVMKLCSVLGLELTMVPKSSVTTV